ncbi:MAG: phage minor head protein [Candidatus Promineifilaceae bacterium]
MKDVIDWIRAHDFDLSYIDVKITRLQNALLRWELVNFISDSELTPLEADHRTKLAKRLEPAFGSDEAETIACTELTRAYVEGNLASWRVSGVTTGKIWISMYDEQTCATCRRLHQMVIMLDEHYEDRYDGPPAHAGCRCTLSPHMLSNIDLTDYWKRERWNMHIFYRWDRNRR